MGRSRGGLTSKIHALVDTNGLPVRLALTAGEAHDNRLAGKLLSRLRSGAMLLAERGYDADWIRALAAKKGAWANIPPRCNRSDPICFSPYLYRARNLVERFFNRIKHCRRVATRYDKLAANYLAFVQLASIRLWLRVDESASQSAARRLFDGAIKLLGILAQRAARGIARVVHVAAAIDGKLDPVGRGEWRHLVEDHLGFEIRRNEIARAMRHQHAHPSVGREQR